MNFKTLLFFVVFNREFFEHDSVFASFFGKFVMVCEYQQNYYSRTLIIRTRRDLGK